jgi:hypothetical protein
MRGAGGGSAGGGFSLPRGARAASPAGCFMAESASTHAPQGICICLMMQLSL